MDAIIQKYDLKNGNDKTSTDLKEELQTWKREKMSEATNTDMVLRALAIVQTKVAIVDFPTVESASGRMARWAFGIISDCISHLVIEEKTKRKDFYMPLTDFLLELLTVGPGTTHLELIAEVYKVDELEFISYFQTLKGEDLRKVITLCKKEYKPKEKISYEAYAEKVLYGMSYVLDIGLSDKQYQAQKADFLDLYLYFRYGFLDRKEAEQNMMSEMSDWIYRHLDCKPFHGSKDKAVYASFFNRLKDVILVQSYPTNNEAVELIENALTAVFDAMREEGNLNDVYKELMDLSFALFTEKTGRPVHKLIDTIGYFFYCVEEGQVKRNPEMFEYICQKLIQIVEETKDQSLLAESFVDTLVADVLVRVMPNSASHAGLLIKLIKALIQIPLVTTLHGAVAAIRERADVLIWKEHIPEARDLFLIISQLNVPKGKNRSNIMEKYKDFARHFLVQIRKERIQQEFNDGLVHFVLRVLESRNSFLYDIAQEVAERTEFDAKKDKALVMEVFNRMAPLLKNDKYPWRKDEELDSLASQLIENAAQGVTSGDQLEESDYNVIISIIKTVMVKDFIHVETGTAGSVFYIAYSALTTSLLQRLDEINELGWATPLFGGLIDLLDHKLDDVRHMAGLHLDIVCRNSGEVLSPHMDKLVSTFLKHESPSVLGVIINAYPTSPGPVNRQFQKFMKYLDKGDLRIRMQVLHLYAAVAKHHPETFTEQNLEASMMIAEKDPSSQVQLMMIFGDVAKKQPDKVGKFLPQLTDNQKLAQSDAQPFVINILKQIGVRSEKFAEQVLEYFAKTLEGPEEQTLIQCTLDGMRNVGGKHLALLSKHKELIEGVRERAQLQFTKDGCNGLIDIIEGRSLAALSEGIKETQEDVDELDTKIGQTHENVKVVSKEVTQHTREIKTVKKDVKVQSQKVEELEQTVDNTVTKVEEIDSKTLNHAPFWSRDVSKLMNPKDDNDWRLLSSRLGYNNDDIRAWSQQHDPCMAMLNEWYAARKTSEATFAVLTALQEMDRVDAAAIVENAMKMAETIVEDEPFEYPSPPAVFISYQWGMQTKVKLLKQHLEMAGYECWLDIGQMGGGDKLFEKIDQGIRAAKVIISCVTEKYATSPNCNREVNLSVSLGRPIVPLLMEKQTWPPAGAMGPIFSEYLYIRFYTRPGEKAGNKTYWPGGKFQELLMQLNYNGIVPMENKVQKQYKNWWIPVVEEIKIVTKRDGSKSQSRAETAISAEVSSVSPDVFISYQWGKQKQIMLLYKRLTGLGYSCWMDIFQMGGGDSLFEKIDKGVRGCKLVLSCVTTKYALSANCRREVSLADALKKPIVPLLLEKISWPPIGPMSMVFTQLLYINFSEDEKVQEKWTGKDFDEVVVKIKEIVPNLSGEDKTTSDVSEQKNTESDKMSPFAKSPASDVTMSQRRSDASSPLQVKRSQTPSSIKPPAGQNKERHSLEVPPSARPRISKSDSQQSKSCTVL